MYDDPCPFTTLEDYQRDVTWSPYRFLGQIIRDQELLITPLTYPDPDDVFYGYTKKRIDAWYPHNVAQGTKELITGVTRTATALLALQAQRYVGSKSASIRHYRSYIGDGWSGYLETLNQKSKDEWQYMLPRQAADLALLGELCQQTLAFENHYFQVYRSYLLDCLHGSQAARLFAAQRLTQVIYGDQEMGEALHSNTHDQGRDVTAMAQQALAQLHAYRSQTDC